MFTSIWTSIQDIGVFKCLCTVAVGVLFVYIFVAGGKGGKGGSGSSTPPAQG